MNRFSLVFGVLVCSASVWGQSAQVTMNEEPHHERLTYVQHMRVFEIILPAGEMTRDHLRDHDVATLALGDATTRSRTAGGDWSAPMMRAHGSAEITAYTGAPAVHGMENVGATPVRMFVVENLRDAGAWSTLQPIDAPGTTLRQEGRSFAVYDIRLNTETPQTRHVHQNPTLVVLLSGAVSIGGAGGESDFRLEQAGRWVPSFGVDQPHALTSVGTGEAHLLCIEAR